MARTCDPVIIVPANWTPDNSLLFSGIQISNGEEQVLYQTIGFIPTASRSLHAVFGNVPDYNPHIVDLKISKLRGTPLNAGGFTAFLAILEISVLFLQAVIIQARFCISELI